MALEEIRRLKYRYLRCVDLKLWDELAEVFTADAVAEYDTPVLGRTLMLEGRDAILGYMRANLGPDKISAHTVGCPEIEVEGERATGVWSLDDTIIIPERRLLIRGAAYYHDAYRRGGDGRWRVERTGHRRTYEYTMSLEDVPSLELTTAH